MAEQLELRSAVVADSVVVPAGTAAADAVAAAGAPATGPKAAVVVRDPSGRLRDLSWVPEADTPVEPVTIDSPDGLGVLRHSTAHVLARVREAPPAAAGVRHRLADPRPAQGVPEAAGGGGPARPPQAGRRAGPVQLPRGDRLRPRGVPPQGRHHPARAGELLAGAARG